MMFAHLHLHHPHPGHHHDLHELAVAAAAVAATVTLSLGAARVLAHHDGGSSGAPSSARSLAQTEQVIDLRDANVPAAVVTTVQLSGVDGAPVAGQSAPPLGIEAVPNVAVAGMVTYAVLAPEGMTIEKVSLFDEAGSLVAAGVPTEGAVRFDGLAGGSYVVVYQAGTGVSTDERGAAISAVVAATSDPILVPAGTALVVTSG